MNYKILFSLISIVILIGITNSYIVHLRSDIISSEKRINSEANSFVNSDSETKIPTIDIETISEQDAVSFNHDCSSHSFANEDYNPYEKYGFKNFGELSEVRLENIPPGKLHNQIAALSPHLRNKVFEQLKKVAPPINNIQSLNVDQFGNLFFAFEMPQAPYIPIVKSIKNTNFSPVPISSPPDRSSRPGAPNISYLDFNGHVVTGTAWNTGNVATSLDCQPFDQDGDKNTFSDIEQQIIIQTWELVAEDFLPFNVNVTTVEPAPAQFATNLFARALIT